MNTTGRYAYLGYAADVFRLACFSFSNPHSLTKFFQINTLRKRTGARQLIEAGTYLGITAQRCGASLRERVHDRARPVALYRKKRPGGSRRTGTSCSCRAMRSSKWRKILQRSDVDRAIIFWDGHCCGGYAQSGDETGAVAEPVLEGLERIAPQLDKIQAIVIDDFNFWGVAGLSLQGGSHWLS